MAANKQYDVHFQVTSDYVESVAAKNSDEAIWKARLFLEDIIASRYGSRSVDVVKVEEKLA